MPELLLELGCEELPAAFVKKAYLDLEEAVARRLQQEEIPFEKGSAPIGTPRRLIVHFREVAESQPDRTKEMRGPSVKAAFDADGKPTKALEGFCRGQGCDPSEARDDGDYVWITKKIPGRPTLEVLQEVLPEAIRSLSFEKSMRWGAARMRFARPIRWILASFGGRLVSFDIEGVSSGLSSRGHRFEHPESFDARTFDELVNGLIARKVEPDPAERERRIREGMLITASGKPDIKPELLDENVFLTEWPTPIEGEFKEEYLALPEAVLATAMAKHEKMFPLRGGDGRLVNRFIFVRNSGEDASVRAGAEWVLNARFNDAKFFFDEDVKLSMSEFLEKTKGILFQERLGTVRQRADRLSALAQAIAKETGADEGEAELAKQAGLFCKADLATGLVSELASLQGIVGGEYAKREGFPDAACWAIASHYDLSKNPHVDGPGARTAVRVLIADQLDKLVGFLGIGLLPSGSSDPFGLRRAATMLIEAAWAWPEAELSFGGAMLERAIELYGEQGNCFGQAEVLAKLREVLAARYASLLESERFDFVEATKAWVLEPRSALRRLNTLKEIATDFQFIQTATRPINILAAAVEKGQFQPGAQADWESKLSSHEERALLEAARAFADDPAPMTKKLKSLEAPINRFFDTTMVMDSDPAVRQARLELVQLTSQALYEAGDLSKIVLEG